LRAIGGVAADFRGALRLHLIETSPRLRAIQAERLADATWHEGLDTLPHAPMLLLANEFLDALPVRQLIARKGMWLERFVEDGRFVDLPAGELASTGSSMPASRDEKCKQVGGDASQCAAGTPRPRRGAVADAG
jgi:SAM-dependent MidA family methyltransferase